MDDDQDTAAAMAAAMGFSSFGTQNPNKRRKFNPSADAVVATDSPSTSSSALPLHQHRGSAAATTGSNRIPLGIRKQNTNEIDLDDHEDGKGDRMTPVGGPVQETMIGDFDEPYESQYLDTSRPSAPTVTDPSDDYQSKIDAILGSSTGGHSFSQPPNPSRGGGHSTRGGRRGGYRNTKRDDRSETNWWENYYDPASIVNPWASLEKSLGLEPRGSWLTWEEAKAARR
ncbi:hypothetical protein GGS21DRAFT_345356 [Xylaria nigripes]|nr:hypothetical protein GGS21DRAFT_345356 [Xylaria nigripes]